MSSTIYHNNNILVYTILLSPESQNIYEFFCSQTVKYIMPTMHCN